MDANRMACDILTYVGEKENIIKNMICVSRLRLELKDKSKVDLESLKELEGVLGIIEAETLQIVLGTANVSCVGKEFSRLTGLPLEIVEVFCVPGEPCPSDLDGIKDEGIIEKIFHVFRKKS